MESSSRDVTFDIMKGIGILLMLVGHLHGIGYARQIIYSFHMPMFFLVAGYFTKGYRCESGKIVVYNYFRRLVRPVIFTYALLFLYLLGLSIVKQDSSIVMPQIIRMFWVSGEPISTKWGLISVGVIWFVVALFWAKMGLYYLSRWPKYVLPISFVVSISALLFHHHVTKLLPWCILQGLMAFSFVAVGYWEKNHGFPMWIKILSVVMWPIAIIFSGIEMYSCEMKCYPLDFIGACGGTIALYYLSKWISKIKHVGLALGYFGIISLAIVSMHEFVDWSDLTNTLFVHSPFAYIRDSYCFFMVIKYVLVLLLAVLVTKLPIMKKFYT